MSDTNETQSNALDLQSLINLQKQYVLDLDRIPTGKQNISSLQSQVVEMNEKLKNLDAAFVQSGNSVNDILLKQGDIYNVLQTENTRLVKEQQDIEDAVSGQKRMININTSYVAKYSEWNKIWFIIITLCIFIIVMHYEYHWFNIIPDFLRYTIYIFAIGFTIFGIVLILVNIASRDKMNFNKIDPPPPFMDNSADAVTQRAEDIASGNLLSLINTCIGEECCNEGTTYDADANICMTNESESSEEVEPFKPYIRLNKRAP
tara:strand:- start:158 stop:940 length:783 start_codon:yes stop_codon:yes gene_type:complete